MEEQEISFEAIEILGADERDAFLRGACGHDVTLRRKIDLLIAEHFSSDSLLAGSTVGCEAWTTTNQPKP